MDRRSTTRTVRFSIRENNMLFLQKKPNCYSVGHGQIIPGFFVPHVMTESNPPHVGQAVLIGEPLDEQKVDGTSFLIVRASPGEGDAHYLWLPHDKKEAPPLIGKRLLNATITIDGGVPFFVPQASDEKCVHILGRTGILRAHGESREDAVIYYKMAHGGGVVRLQPHGFCPVENDAACVDGTRELFKNGEMPESELLWSHIYAKNIGGIRVVFQVDELWKIPEGCSIVMVDAAQQQGVPCCRLRNEHSVIKAYPPHAGDLERFFAYEGRHMLKAA